MGTSASLAIATHDHYQVRQAPGPLCAPMHVRITGVSANLIAVPIVVARKAFIVPVGAWQEPASSQSAQHLR
jgi:hypothetical protein